MENQQLVSQNDEQLLHFFEVEELENRLEFAWISEVVVKAEYEPAPGQKVGVEVHIPIPVN
jgi:hypothetical protein